MAQRCNEVVVGQRPPMHARPPTNRMRTLNFVLLATFHSSSFDHLHHIAPTLRPNRPNGAMKYVLRLVCRWHCCSLATPRQGRSRIERYRRSFIPLPGCLCVSRCSYRHLATSQSASSCSFGSRYRKEPWATLRTNSGPINIFSRANTLNLWPRSWVGQHQAEIPDRWS